MVVERHRSPVGQILVSVLSTYWCHLVDSSRLLPSYSSMPRRYRLQIAVTLTRL